MKMSNMHYFDFSFLYSVKIIINFASGKFG